MGPCFHPHPQPWDSLQQILACLPRPAALPARGSWGQPDLWLFPASKPLPPGAPLESLVFQACSDLRPQATHLPSRACPPQITPGQPLPGPEAFFHLSPQPPCDAIWYSGPRALPDSEQLGLPSPRQEEFTFKVSSQATPGGPTQASLRPLSAHGSCCLQLRPCPPAQPAELHSTHSYLLHFCFLFCQSQGNNCWPSYLPGFVGIREAVSVQKAPSTVPVSWQHALTWLASALSAPVDLVTQSALSPAASPCPEGSPGHPTEEPSQGCPVIQYSHSLGSPGEC